MNSRPLIVRDSRRMAFDVVLVDARGYGGFNRSIVSGRPPKETS